MTDVSPAFRAEILGAVALAGLDIPPPVFRASGDNEAAFFPTLASAAVSFRGGPIEWRAAASVAPLFAVHADGQEKEPLGRAFAASLRNALLWLALFWAVCALLSRLS